jgi:hypothetical protein
MPTSMPSGSAMAGWIDDKAQPNMVVHRETSPWQDQLGPPARLISADRDANGGKRSSTYYLADSYTGRLGILASTIVVDAMRALNDNAQIIQALMPPTRKEEMQFFVSRLICENTMMQELPPRSVPDILQTTKQQETFSTKRLGMGLQVEYQFSRTDQGRQIVEAQKANIVKITRDTLSAMAMLDLLEYHNREQWSRNTFGLQANVEDILRRQAAYFGIIQKNRHGLMHVISEVGTAMRRIGKIPDLYVLPERALKFAAEGFYDSLDYKNQGPNALELQRKGQGALTGTRGVRYLEWAAMRIDDARSQGYQFDPLKRTVNIGDQFRFADWLDPKISYSSAMRSTRVMSLFEGDGDFVNVTLMQAIQGSNMFKTNDLQGGVVDMLNEYIIQVNSKTKPAPPRRDNGASLLHVLAYQNPNTNQFSPVDFVGQMEQEYMPEESFLAMAASGKESIRAQMQMDANEFARFVGHIDAGIQLANELSESIPGSALKSYQAFINHLAGGFRSVTVAASVFPIYAPSGFQYTPDGCIDLNAAPVRQFPQEMFLASFSTNRDIVAGTVVSVRGGAQLGAGPHLSFYFPTAKAAAADAPVPSFYAISNFDATGYKPFGEGVIITAATNCIINPSRGGGVDSANGDARLLLGLHDNYDVGYVPFPQKPYGFGTASGLRSLANLNTSLPLGTSWRSYQEIAANFIRASDQLYDVLQRLSPANVCFDEQYCPWYMQLPSANVVYTVPPNLGYAAATGFARPLNAVNNSVTTRAAKSKHSFIQNCLLSAASPMYISSTVVAGGNVPVEVYNNANQFNWDAPNTILIGANAAQQTRHNGLSNSMQQLIDAEIANPANRFPATLAADPFLAVAAGTVQWQAFAINVGTAISITDTNIDVKPVQSTVNGTAGIATSLLPAIVAGDPGDIDVVNICSAIVRNLVLNAVTIDSDNSREFQQLAGNIITDVQKLRKTLSLAVFFFFKIAPVLERSTQLIRSLLTLEAREIFGNGKNFIYAGVFADGDVARNIGGIIAHYPNGVTTFVGLLGHLMAPIIANYVADTAAAAAGGAANAARDAARRRLLSLPYKVAEILDYVAFILLRAAKNKKINNAPFSQASITQLIARGQENFDSRFPERTGPPVDDQVSVAIRNMIVTPLHINTAIFTNETELAKYRELYFVPAHPLMSTLPVYAALRIPFTAVGDAQAATVFSDIQKNGWSSANKVVVDIVQRVGSGAAQDRAAKIFSGFLRARGKLSGSQGSDNVDSYGGGNNSYNNNGDNYDDENDYSDRNSRPSSQLTKRQKPAQARFVDAVAPPTFLQGMANLNPINVTDAAPTVEMSHNQILRLSLAANMNDTLMRAFSLLIISSPMNLSQLKIFYDNNIRIPLGVLALRANKTYTTGSGIAAQTPVGFIAYGHENVMMSADALQKMLFANFTLHAGSVVEYPDNYTIMSDCFVNGYIGGEGVKPISRSAFRSNSRQNVGGDVLYLLVPEPSLRSGTNLPKVSGYVSTTGRWEHSAFRQALKSDATPELHEHFIGSGFYNTFYGMSNMGQGYAMFSPDLMSTEETFNTACLQAQQFIPNPYRPGEEFVIPAQDHFGANGSFKGCRAQRCGDTEPFKELNWVGSPQQRAF